MIQDDTTNPMLALLDWYRDMGVTQPVDEIATDWRGRGNVAPGKGFRYPERGPSDQSPSVAAPPLVVPTAPPVPVPLPVARTPAPAVRPAVQPIPRTFPTVLPDEAALLARQQAAAASSLDDLRQQLEAFDGCALKATAKQLCFFRGAKRARLMVIGEAPGRDEDIAGLPFVGPSGQLLDAMLTAIGESKDTAHITNIVYWRPPGNRTPTPQEGQICRPFLERQIELVGPEIVLLLGGAAAKHMLNSPEGIMKLRGTWRTIDIAGKELRTMASLHPIYLLRTPAAKRQAWADLLAVKLALKN